VDKVGIPIFGLDGTGSARLPTLAPAPEGSGIMEETDMVVLTTDTKGWTQNNIEILPQHRIYPNNSPINLIPFPIAIHHARDIRAAADLQKIKENFLSCESRMWERLRIYSGKLFIAIKYTCVIQFKLYLPMQDPHELIKSQHINYVEQH
jgi:hypothetical protein